MRAVARLLPALLAGALVAAPAAAGSPATSSTAAPPTAPRETAPPQAPPPKAAVATGAGGAVASVDADATAVGLAVLADGGNAIDAAVATAAALGVTEPYSSGIGGGGYLVAYLADERSSGSPIVAYDGRETAPATFTATTLTDGAGSALDFDTVVSSGLSVGVPGTPALWERVLRDAGTRSLADVLAPAQDLARRGFVVDATYAAQTAANAARFAMFPETARTFLVGGAAPTVGSTVTNPDLARAYADLAAGGVEELYRGGMGAALVAAARTPSTADGVSVPAGQITTADLAAYDVRAADAVRSDYGDLQLAGAPPSSSGGTSVAEITNLLEAYEAKTGVATKDVSEADFLHRFAEASATTFADRGRWVGQGSTGADGSGGVPVEQLVSQGFADERACQLFDPARAQPRPVPAGSPDGTYDAPCAAAGGDGAPAGEEHGTTHLTVADRWGNVVSYTLTIEQTGGSGITVPGYGFLLNNELTDFDPVPVVTGAPDPNLPGPGRRPRSSISPTIVLEGGRPVLALGSPGGATIITTVAQVLAERYGRGLSLADAVAAPRISSRNAATSEAEPAIAGGPLGADLTSRGHSLTTVDEIGAATAIALLPGGRFEAVAEPVRRGGGAAAVVVPDAG